MNIDNSLSALLYQLETRLHRLDTRHSSEELTELLAEEFVEFGSSGRVYNRKQIIASLAEESSIEISIADFKAVNLAPDIALVTYRAVVIENNNPPHHSWRSSIWKLQGGKWRMVFHQGTPTGSE